MNSILHQQLTSDLKANHLLEQGVTVGFYKERNAETIRFYDQKDGIPFLKDIRGLMDWLGVEFVVDEWRLFIDASSSALKIVLLHNGNVFPSVPVLYSAKKKLQENYEDMKYALDLINYEQYKFKIIADLKLLNVLCGLGPCSSKFPCILCHWKGTNRSNKRHLQYHQEDVQLRNEFNENQFSVLHQPLIDLEHVLLPSLHIKIGLCSQFVKALPVNGAGFAFISNLFNFKSAAKRQAGQFNGPEIRTLLKNTSDFVKCLNEKEKRAWLAFKSVAENFLGKQRAANYQDLCKELVSAYEAMGCNASLKVHVIQSHLDRFPPNCSDFSDEMGERFHQEIKLYERRYQGRFDVAMLSDYVWTLKRDSVLKSRKNRRRSSFPCKSNA